MTLISDSPFLEVKMSFPLEIRGFSAIQSFNKFIKKSLNINDRGKRKPRREKLHIVTNKESTNLMGMNLYCMTFVFKKMRWKKETGQ